MEIAAEVLGVADDEAEAIQLDPEEPLTDENLAVPKTILDEKQYFYNSLGIPLASDDESPVQAFFTLLEGPEKLKQQVIDFATTCMNEKRTSGTTPTDSFFQIMRPQTWEPYCPGADEEWETWKSRCESLGLSAANIKAASKMSGPRDTSLNIMWHFPTYRVGRVLFGFTADPRNPCLAMQHRKIGADPTVCWNDLIPI